MAVGGRSGEWTDHAEEALSMAHKSGARLMMNGRGINLIFFDTNDPKETVKRSQTLVYTCLPDTVDPRGGRS